MFIPRIYQACPLACHEAVELTEATHHYLMSVLRLSAGDPIILFNGEGGEYHGSYCPSKKKSQAQLHRYENPQTEASLPIVLVQSLARGDRMDFVIQKATELGVTEIVIIIPKRSQVKLDKNRADNRLSHWQKIAISASEQSGRTHLPLINAPCDFSQWLKKPFTGTSMCFQPHSQQNLRTFFSSSQPPAPIRIAIGPESGWDPQEHEQLLAHGFTSLHLGPRILRTETAAITAISLVQGLWGDL